jgi:hypothetical protein
MVVGAGFAVKFEIIGTFAGGAKGERKEGEVGAGVVGDIVVGLRAGDSNNSAREGEGDSIKLARNDSEEVTGETG